MGAAGERFVDRGDVRIHYSVEGEGQEAIPLLLTHGFSASSAMWEPNLAELSASRQVVTWDIRGHGRTVVPARPELYSQDVSVEDMAAVLDACRLERAAIGGLSLALAARHILTQHGPEVIEALGRVAVPTLVLVGELDKPFLKAADYMASHIPGAKKVVLPGAGHAANIDQPEAFNQAVAAFMAGL